MAEALLSGVLRKLGEFAFVKAAEKFQSLYTIREEVEKLSRELSYIHAIIEDVDEKYVADNRQIKWLKDVMDIAYQIEDVVDRENKKRKIDPGFRLDPIGDPEVVGFARDIDEVVKHLLDKENRNLTVVSVVGPGGIGKTTLTRKVCHSNDVVKSFGKAIWITISQKYNLLHILRKIAQDLNIMSNNLNMNMNELAFLISKSLEKRMYLIVFDDIWTEEFWAEIINVLPDTRNGSRVLVTTRFVNVAKKTDTAYEPYVLPVLDDKNSLELFLKKAVPKRLQFPDGPTIDFYNLATKFTAKCKGLPLALVVLGGLLSIRPYDYHAWNELLQTMSWHDDGIECARIMATSYDHLPFAKKLCFLYFAAFPEDQMIEAKPLLRIWVAERLIPHEERRTLEETAECFLEDLVQRYHLHCYVK
ncbi:CC-NBS-LRR disease resistance protein [Rhynchospora pubera]|uniref:CC-NBS-LRR disease resistance protein n=1 Tax=Rhynchospora pubera TaxID=906938 RepID=A0AAV8CRE2_9POAL|nr:CC-NBS-LRR disease resistance protein [Rhynchospora pubera]